MKPSLPTLAGVMTAALIAAAPALADPPPWAPAHGHRAKQAARQYQYVYYPAQQVYYAPATQSWFWLNGGNWQVGVSLPTQLQPYVQAGVPITLDTPRPYVRHVHVEQQYGRPWREKHGHGKRGKHEKHGRYKHDD